MEKKRNTKRTVLTVLAVIGAVIVLMLGALALYVDYLIGLLVDPNPNLDGSTTTFQTQTLPPESTYVPSSGESVATVPSTMPSVPADIIEVEDVITVMLLGQDANGGYARTRTDSMILCTIHTKDRVISMTSFQRDLWVNIPGWGHNKLNAAYVFGGFELFKETMEYNFGLQIDHIMLVEMERFAEVINILNGVDVNLEQRECDYLNPIYGWNLQAGWNHLNGDQALAYSRIRYIDSNWQRAERQKNVLRSILTAYRQKPVLELLSVTQKILPLLHTYDLEKDEVYDYIFTLAPMISNCTTENYQFPKAGTFTSGLNEDGIWVIEADLEANREYLAGIIAP